MWWSKGHTYSSTCVVVGHTCSKVEDTHIAVVENTHIEVPAAGAPRLLRQRSRFIVVGHTCSKVKDTHIAQYLHAVLLVYEALSY